LTSYNGPREIRVSSDDPKLKQDLDRLVADSVRAQPPVRRSVVRWQKSVPVSLDSTVICFVPSAGDTMVLPRPLPVDDGRTIVIAVATGSGVLTVEAPRGASVTKVGESADIRTLEQPGAYTFTVIDGVYYVATAISGSIPPSIITEAMEITGPALVGRSSADTGTTTEIALDPILSFDGDVLQIDPTILYVPLELGSTPTDWALCGDYDSGSVEVIHAALSNASAGYIASALEIATVDTTRVLTIREEGVTETYIGPSAVTSAKIANSAVTTGKIANLAVTTGKIDDLAVITGKIDDLAVTTGKIDAAAVSTSKIADGAVTRVKLDDFGRYFCAVTNSTDQSFTAASGNQTVNWFSELSDDDALHSTASNTGRITIPALGMWEIAWDFFATQAGTLSFFRDGTTQISDGYAVAANTVNSGVIKRNIPSSGYIEMVFDINTNGTSSGPSCSLTVTSLAL
jgi:hypothetical protein